MATETSGDRFEASAVCQKIVGLFGQQALTAFAAQVLSIYETQLSIASSVEEDDEILT